MDATVWHITPVSCLDSILRHGLQPQIGPRSAAVGEEMPAVYFFRSFDDVEDSANWLFDCFPAEEPLALLKATVPESFLQYDGEAWAECHNVIPPSCIAGICLNKI